MNHKSGLADNPLFSNPSTAEQVNPGVLSQPVGNGGVGTGGEQANGRTGEHPNVRTPVHLNSGTPARPHGRTPERVNTRTDKRPISRQSYNVYSDQHLKLQRLEAESKLAGKPIPISDLVRQALDHYLKRYP